MRMSMKRFARLSNGFSKKVENHEHMLALHYMYYNFARIHQTLRVTPAMEAGVADHVWGLDVPDMIRQYGLKDDGSVITDFDLIEVDEGRWYPDMWRDAWR